MSEHLVVDSLMTADGEVVQLPTLGPLGPVDAQGGRIPLDTVIRMQAASGMCSTRQERVMTFNDVEFKACPRCGVEPKMEDVRERSLTKPNVMSVKCPACGMSNSIAWGSMDLPPFRQAVAMLADLSLIHI